MVNRLFADNRRMLGKLLVIVAVMFGFGYALVPMYRAICDALGINVLTLSDQRISSGSWSNNLHRCSSRWPMKATSTACPRIRKPISRWCW